VVKFGKDVAFGARGARGKRNAGELLSGIEKRL
jgi:hypothetical protein